MTALEGTLLTGFFTLAAVVVTFILQGRQQRNLDRDRRVWDRRAEMYVAMLQYQGSGMVEGNITAATAAEWAVRDELTAKAAAFASDEVRSLWQQSARASLTLQEYVEDEWPQLIAGGGRTEAAAEAADDQELQRFRQASAHAGKQLTDQIRTELGISRSELLRWRRRSQGSLEASTGRPAGPLPPGGSE